MDKAIDAVAKRLGNTRTVCRKYYVHPGLVLAYLKGLTAPRPGTNGAPRGRRGASLPRPRCGATRSRCCNSCREDAPDD